MILETSDGRKARAELGRSEGSVEVKQNIPERGVLRTHEALCFRFVVRLPSLQSPKLESSFLFHNRSRELVGGGWRTRAQLLFEKAVGLVGRHAACCMLHAAHSPTRVHRFCAYVLAQLSIR